jgi:hypothetical protein
MLGSRKAKERAAGAHALLWIVVHDVGVNNNRGLVEFQEAVAAAGGIPVIVRALGAVDTAVEAALVVAVLR